MKKRITSLHVRPPIPEPVRVVVQKNAYMYRVVYKNAIDQMTIEQNDDLSYIVESCTFSSAYLFHRNINDDDSVWYQGLSHLDHYSHVVTFDSGVYWFTEYNVAKHFERLYNR